MIKSITSIVFAFIMLSGAFPLESAQDSSSPDPTETKRKQGEAMLHWESVKTAHVDTLKRFKVFFEEHSEHAQFLPEVEKAFIKHLYDRGEVDKGRFVIRDIKIGDWQSLTVVNISRSPSGHLLMHGTSGGDILGAQAIHRWVETVPDIEMQNTSGGFDTYTFIGNQTDPLTFGCVWGVGYVYLHGKGAVIMPDGSKITLGTRATAASEVIGEAQSLLTKLGYDPGPIDGVLGSRSAKAIRYFQRDNGIPQTGSLDTKTLEALKTSASAKVSTEKPASAWNSMDTLSAEQFIASIDFSSWKPETFRVSPDAKRLAYVHEENNNLFVVVNNKQEGPYDGVQESGPVFSPDSKHVAYAAIALGKQFVVLDGKKGGRYDAIDKPGPVFSHDSKHLAYTARIGTNWFIVMNEQEGTYYDGVSGPIFFLTENGSLFQQKSTISSLSFWMV